MVASSTEPPERAAARLAGQAAVVTGASSGIGATIARVLAAEGVRLVVTARRAERLAALAEETGATVVVGDITEPELPRRLLDTALERYSRCDILVNNAGLLEVAPLATIDLERVAEMVRVNVEAAFRAALVFARHFAAQDRGHLLSLSSVLGTKVRATAGAYAGTKHALEALSEALRLELADTHVRVSVIEPGLVATELHARWETPPAEALGIPQPLTPADIAECALFVLTRPEHVRLPRLMILPVGHVI